MTGILNLDLSVRGLTLVSRKLSYSSTRGDIVVESWEGSPEAVASQYSELRTLRPDLDFSLDDSSAPTWVLNIVTPDISGGQQQTSAVETWELVGNDIQKEIWEHPRTVNYVVDSDLLAIREFAKNPSEARIPEFTGTGDALEAAEELLYLVKKNVTAYVTSQYVLRRTQTIGAKATIRASYSGIDTVFTTAQLTAAGGLYALPFPAEILFSIAEIPEPTAQTNYVWGWLKKTPTVQQVSGNKYQITQEWWLEQWSTYLYPPAA